jgi:hypothetical protein
MRERNCNARHYQVLTDHHSRGEPRHSAIYEMESVPGSPSTWSEVKGLANAADGGIASSLNSFGGATSGPAQVEQLVREGAVLSKPSAVGTGSSDTVIRFSISHADLARLVSRSGVATATVTKVLTAIPGGISGSVEISPSGLVSQQTINMAVVAGTYDISYSLTEKYSDYGVAVHVTAPKTQGSWRWAATRSPRIR